MCPMDLLIMLMSHYIMLYDIINSELLDEDDHNLKVLVTDMLCTLIPVYGKVVKRSDH